MIKRIVNHCYWLQCYLERVECSARLLRAYNSSILDLTLIHMDKTHPFLTLAGLNSKFEELEEVEDVLNALIWEEQNEDSLFSNFKKARQNAHMLRQILHIDSWVVLNSLWIWLNDSEMKKYQNNKSAKYEPHKDINGLRIHAIESELNGKTAGLPHEIQTKEAFLHMLIKQCCLFHGILHDNQRKDEIYHFMQIGTFIEKAYQTARLIHESHLYFSKNNPFAEEPDVYWSLILEGAGAKDSFSRSSRNFNVFPISDYLFFDPYFPRSVEHCLSNLQKTIHALEEADLGGRHEFEMHDIQTALSNFRSSFNAKNFSKKTNRGKEKLLNFTEEIVGYLNELRRETIKKLESLA